jgi:hypothetical protein
MLSVIVINIQMLKMSSYKIEGTSYQTFWCTMLDIAFNNIKMYFLLRFNPPHPISYFVSPSKQ